MTEPGAWEPEIVVDADGYDQELVLADGAGHSHVLDALRQLLASGRSATIETLCAEGIAGGLLPAGTLAKYVANAVRGETGRQQLRGERPSFVFDGDYVRLNVPRDPFAGYQAAPSEAAFDVEALITKLVVTAHQGGGAADDSSVGAPFERAVAEACAHFGLITTHDGRQGRPDVVATAPLGDAAYTVVFECKSADGNMVQGHDASIPEIAKFRDALRARYGVLSGPGFPAEETLDTELAAHNIALWTVDDLALVLRAAAHHAIAWSSLATLFAPGRASDAIAAFTFAHEHGAYERALVTYRYILSEGLAYQELLVGGDPDVERPSVPLTLEVLATLVNQRLAAEGDTARVGVEDIRIALALATHPSRSTASIDASGHIAIQSRSEYRPPTDVRPGA